MVYNDLCYQNQQYRQFLSIDEGIRISKGNYIARMDGDDISMPHRLEKQLTFMEKYLDISLIGSSMVCIDENKGVDEAEKIDGGSF